MNIINKFKDLHRKLPIFLRKPLFQIFSFLMRFISPIIVLKMNKGKFLNKNIKKLNMVNEIIEFVFSFQYLPFSMKIGQVKYEIIQLLNILRDLNLNTILEIGTAGGGSLFLFTRIANPEAIIISVDLPKGYFGGGYNKWKIPIYHSFVKDKQEIKLLRENSHTQKTFELVKESLNGKSLDFLFIDGDHTYDGVKKDFEMYSTLVKKGGIIAFHDIAEHSTNSGCNVDKFWNEIKNNYNSLEILQDKNQKWAGIGVLYF